MMRFMPSLVAAHLVADLIPGNSDGTDSFEKDEPLIAAEVVEVDGWSAGRLDIR